DDRLIMIVHAVVLDQRREQRRRVDHPSSHARRRAQLPGRGELTTTEHGPVHAREPGDLGVHRLELVGGGRRDDRRHLAAVRRRRDESACGPGGRRRQIVIRGGHRLIQHHPQRDRHGFDLIAAGPRSRGTRPCEDGPVTDDAARPRRRTWIGWVVGSVLVLLVIAAGWVAIRGIGATVALSQGAQTIERARALVAADEIEDLSRMAARASAHAQNAHSLTSDPVWRAAELVPWIGADLRAMRETAEIADELAGRVRGPLLDAAYEARLGPVELSG